MENPTHMYNTIDSCACMVQNPYQIVTASELWGIYTCHGCPYGKFTMGSAAEV